MTHLDHHKMSIISGVLLLFWKISIILRGIIDIFDFLEYSSNSSEEAAMPLHEAAAASSIDCCASMDLYIEHCELPSALLLQKFIKNAHKRCHYKRETGATISRAERC